MPWIESHTSLRYHPKVARLSRKLAIPIPAAMGHLHCLWHWALEFAPDGDISKFDVEEIADAAMFDPADYDLSGGDRSGATFVKALVDSRWLDESEHSLTLHDWWEYSGQLMESRRQAQEGGKLGNHKRWHQERGIVDPTCSFCRADVSPPMSPPDIPEHRPPSRGESHRTVPNRTEQNQDQEHADFQTFWDTYPRHHQNGKPGGGASKSKTADRWKKLSERDRALCLTAVVNYAEATSHPTAPFPAHATTWLNEKRWLDWLEPADYSLARGPAPPKDRFAEMAERFQQGEAVTNGQADRIIDATGRGLPAGQRS